MYAIPVIDFRAFSKSESLAEQQQISQEIFAACHQVGFLYLQHHGLDSRLLDQAFAQTQQLFALPTAIKRSLAWSEAASNRGYIAVERERLDPTQPGDLKEAFNIGPEIQMWDDATEANEWLPEDATFRAVMRQFFKSCCQLEERVLRAVAIALQLPADFFLPTHRQYSNILRLLHYPPTQQQPKLGQIRAGAHTDYGSITLLFQDAVGGLEIQTTSGDWIAAPPIPNTVIVNLGDLMQRWTNDVFCSTRHRVGLPTRSGRSRYSIAFFCHPNDDSDITCLPSCQSPEQPPRYPPISARDYLLSRLQATY
jgi:isopenicillin N synthase-like dioxygenase